MSTPKGDGYPLATWIPAHADRFRVMASRNIRQIVLHCTDGGAVAAAVTARNAFGGPRYFENGVWKSQSAHYIVGRAGEVVQTVLHKDMAFHANNASTSTIGVEHNAREPQDKKLAGAQYLASARLVLWLCGRLGLPPTRDVIVGHSEADPVTSHSTCPQRVLNWDTYMAAIDHVQALDRGEMRMRLWGDDDV
jgi:N-acetyl-anhydromuramyl-L-alanine amidase AmpD